VLVLVVGTFENFYAVLAFVIVVVSVILRAQRSFLGGVLGLLAEQRVAVLLGDLVVIGVDFLKARKPWRLPP
jgi:hypothetical protein